MFGTLKNLAKAAIGVATLPVDIAADVVTMAGAMTDQDEPYTASKVRKIVGALEDAADPEKD